MNIGALYYAVQNPDLPLRVKVLISITVAYALSPVDLIPDFIPVLGLLDDLIILPLLLSICIKLIPDEIMNIAAESVKKHPLTLKKNRKAAVVIVVIWLVVIAGIILHFI